MARSKTLKVDMNEKVNNQLKILNKNLKERMAEFQRTETVDLPKVLPAAEELQELKVLIDWCLKLWAEHDGLIFKPGLYFNE